jgi:DNA-binding CsgD family transcriptional regulator
VSKKGEPREPSWTESEISFLRENYIQVPVADIAAQLGRSYESVRRKASKVGVQRQGWGRSFTPEEDAYLRENFTSSQIGDVAAHLGRHVESIRQRSRALGLVNQSTGRRRELAATVRHDYFTQVDTPLKAYLLGLLAADGCVSSSSNCISLRVSVKDAELAEVMRGELSPLALVSRETMAPLPGYVKCREAARFAVTSPQMKADLGRYGVVPRKTFILRWPALLEPHLEAPFILGCFDGDGCLQAAGRPFRWRWELYSASEGFLVSAREAILRHTGLEMIKGVSRRGLHQLRLNGGKSVDVLDAWLHADVPGLGRKRLPAGAYARAAQEADAFRRGAAGRRSRALFPAEEIERARRLRTEGRTIRQIAAETGMSTHAVHNHVRDIPVPPGRRDSKRPREAA